MIHTEKFFIQPTSCQYLKRQTTQEYACAQATTFENTRITNKRQSIESRICAHRCSQS
jgi:hypothetical protein